MLRGSNRFKFPPVEGPLRLEHILDAARKIYDQTGRLEDINYNNLDSLRSNRSVDSIIRKNYIVQAKNLGKKYDFKIPSIALLRAEISGDPIEEHPLIKAREIYPNFQPSKYDWLRYVTLPSKIGVKEAELLGIILADINYAPRITHQENYSFRNSHITISGKTEHRKFYEEVVAPLIREIFNLPAPIELFRNNKKWPNSDKICCYALPAIRLSSRALRTWLDEDLGFPDLPKILVHLPEKRQQLALLEGYVAGKGAIKQANGHVLGINIYEYNKDFADNFVKLTHSLGINARGPAEYLQKSLFTNENQWYRIDINGKYIEDLHLLNPLHQEKLGRAC